MPSSQVQSPPSKSTLLEIPVVAIRASANGLEALTAILRALSTDIAMAFMLIQHLDPKCHSILPELLSNATRIPLLEAIDAMRIEVNRIYVMPSNVDISITDGPLRVETASHRPKAAFAHRHFHALFGGSAQEPGHRRYSLGHRLGWYCGEQMEMDGLAQSLYYSWLASGQTVSPTRPTRLAQDGSYGERYED